MERTKTTTRSNRTGHLFALFSVLCCLCLSPIVTAVDVVRYVDTGSAGGDGTTDAVAGAAAAYTSLAAWEAAEDGLSSVGDNHYVHCNRTNGGGLDTTQCQILTWAADSITVIGDSFPADGVYDSATYYTLSVSGSSAMIAREDNITIRNLQIAVANERGILFYSGMTGIVVDSCIIVGSISASNYYYGIVAEGSGVVYNTTITGFNYDYKNYGLATAGGTVTAYNCTINDCYTGVRQITGTLTVVNCAIFNCTDDIASGTCTYCAIDDADAFTGKVDISPGGVEATDWAAAFTDYTTGDYSIKDTDSVLYGAGTDNPGSGLYSDDIIAFSRTSTWDIGAFEYDDSAAPAAVGQVIIINQM